MEIYWWTVSWTELDHFKLAQSLNNYIKDLANVTAIKIICQNCKIFKIKLIIENPKNKMEKLRLSLYKGLNEHNRITE